MSRADVGEVRDATGPGMRLAERAREHFGIKVEVVTFTAAVFPSVLVPILAWEGGSGSANKA